MKLLGNDVLTQEEFDTHMAETFNPLAQQVEKMSKDIFMLKIAVLVSGILAVAGTVLGMMQVL
jgi:hypothetical protein